MAHARFQTPEAIIVVSTHAYFEVYPPDSSVVDKNNARHPTWVYRAPVDRLGNGIRTVGSGDGLNVALKDLKLANAVRSWSRRFGQAALEHKLGYDLLGASRA